jgi:hypothetical protein
MGFKVETVESCPVTRGSSGVMTMTVEQIAMIAGAVRDKIEWMVLLHGTRSADGYEVKVDRFTVPQQYRSGQEVELAADITLPDDCVGVMHSHHRMGAFFSHTDDTELNPRFPSSIVVAVADNNLGFNYRACGKVVLPCGAMGLVDFDLSIDGVERFGAEMLVDLKAKEGGLTGCIRRQYTDHPDDEYLAVDTAACGLSSGEVIQRPLVFGANGSDLLAAVQSQTVQRVSRQLPAHYQGQGGHGTTGTGPLSTYWERRKAEQDAAMSALDQAKRGGRKGKKGKKHRNGLQKLERPEAQERDWYHVDGRCDECGTKGEIYWVNDTKSWLCDRCLTIVEQTELIEDLSSDDRSVIVIDGEELDKTGVLDGYGFGV